MSGEHNGVPAGVLACVKDAAPCAAPLLQASRLPLWPGRRSLPPMVP